MKRLLAILLIVLLLAGCSTGGDTTAPETSDSTPPVANGLYNPNSNAEKQTNGAVRAYPLGRTTYVGMETIGNKQLLIAKDGELTLLSGDRCEPVAAMVTGIRFDENPGAVDAAVTGVAYYAADTREVIQLNPQLQETGRCQLPEDLQGTPVISVENNEVYFCVGQEICAADLQTQITRKIRVQESTALTLTGCYFDGKILSCQLQDEMGLQTVAYISTETGQTLSEDQNIQFIQTEGDRYYLGRVDGYVQQHIVGTIDDIPLTVLEPSGNTFSGSSLALQLPEDRFEKATAVLKKNGVVTYETKEKGILFSFHDLSGKSTIAQMLLPQVDAPVSVTADSQYVWIIAPHAGTNKQVLYRWDITQSPAEESFSSMQPLYTAQNPDEDGLKLQQEHADWYNNEHGVKIMIWQDAVEETGGYHVVPEYQTKVISDMMTGLEPVYPLFPNTILRRTVDRGWIRVCLVRSIEGGQDWAQFWKNGDCYILLTPQGDVAQSFLQAVSYVIDAHVLGNSRDYDSWDALNPKDFKYDYSYDRYELREDLSLTEGKDRAFIDSFSMTYPHEDRCRIFYYAITEGNEEVFASPVMQSKLKKLCEGIREAYGLEKKEDTYPWEQYLTQEMDFSYT